jgi:uncharacterized membrane protein YhfC
MEDRSLRPSAGFARFFTSHKLRGGYKLKVTQYHLKAFTVTKDLETKPLTYIIYGSVIAAK